MGVEGLQQQAFGVQLDHLRSLLTCSLCHNIVSLPACLLCNHHFCVACLREFFRLRGRDDFCPKCKLPASQRHSRYSPEFDSLVSIYKAMAVTAAREQREKNAKRDGSAAAVVGGDQSCCAAKTDRSDSVSPDVPPVVAAAAEAIIEHNAPLVLPASKRVQLPNPATLLQQGGCHTDGDGRKGGESALTDGSAEHCCQLISPTEVKAQTITEEPVQECQSEATGKNTETADSNGGPTPTVLTVRSDTEAAMTASNGGYTDAGSCRKRQRESNDKKKVSGVRCAFCQLQASTSSSSVALGPMMHYEKGVAVKAATSRKKRKTVVSVHRQCAEWAPDVYYVDGVAENLEKEVGRAQKLKCSCCGSKGAVLGCFVERCVKSYHYPCARSISCRWDEENFLVLCPAHVSACFPGEKVQPKKTMKFHKDQEEKVSDEGGTKGGNKAVAVAVANDRTGKESTAAEDTRIEANDTGDEENTAAAGDMEANCDDKAGKEGAVAAVKEDASCCRRTWPRDWLLCGSGLKQKENEVLASFLKATGAMFTNEWHPHVTHLICGTDDKGAANRTLKFLLATLAGKWILTSHWLEACLNADGHVQEVPFEINLDVHGMVAGPERGRRMAGKRELFRGMGFYLLGDYAPAYRASMEALIAAGGGRMVTHLWTEKTCSKGEVVLVLYNGSDYEGRPSDKADVMKRRSTEAKGLASVVKAEVAQHTWLLDSIAAYTLLPFFRYIQ